MPIWTIGSVEAEPSVELLRWKIFEVEESARHFVGVDSLDFTGRVSSAVVEFDAVAMRGVTQSGRVYHLLGNPGDSEQATYVWDRWCAVNSVRAFEDVTQCVVAGARDVLAGREPD